MTDHPLLIPTSIGPIGAMVSEPDGNRRAAAVFVGGIAGRRFGVNRIWTQTAWDLAGSGFVVLRPDYPSGSGDSGLAKPMRAAEPMKEVVDWFRGELGDLDLLLIGACFGARLAAMLGDTERAPIGIGLVVPAFRPAHQSPITRIGQLVRRRLGGRNGSLPVDQGIAEALRRTLRRTAVWALVGEKDFRTRGELATLRRELGSSASGLVVDEVAGLALHGQPTLESQNEIRERIVQWASSRLHEVAGR